MCLFPMNSPHTAYDASSSPSVQTQLNEIYMAQALLEIIFVVKFHMKSTGKRVIFATLKKIQHIQYDASL